MSEDRKTPKTYGAFVREFPKLGQAWEALREAEEAGPFTQHQLRLLKLAVAVGAQKEGSVHSAVRKARAAGCSDAEIRHVAAVAASTIGLPPAVACWSWIMDVLDDTAAPKKPANAPREA